MATRSIPFPAPRLPSGVPLLRPAVLLALGALTAFGVVGGVAAYYLVSHRPVTDLPVVQQVAKPIPPRRLFDFAGTANPVGIAVSPDGQRIYVAEGGDERQIKVFDREGKPLAQLAPPGSQPGTRGPGPMGVDAQGRLYVAERMNAEIQTYSPSLEWEGGFRPPIVDELKGWLPSGVSIGPDGRVYVTEIGHDEHQVLVFGPDGALLDRLGKSGGLPGGLTYPFQAVADDQGRVYVSDGNAARVLAISPRGIALIDSAGRASLGLPRGLAVSGDKLFVADSAAGQILVFSVGDRPDFLYAFGATGGIEGLAYPNGVAVDRTGRIYVADRANDRVQVWTY